MNVLQKLSQSIAFTPNERRVILFLMLSFFVGGIIKIYKTSHATQPQFQYAVADSEFAAKSARIAHADSSQHDALTARYGTNVPVVSKVHNGSRININTARKEELMKLPGVGEATAEEIMNYREDHGTMKSVDELMNIKGIGKKKFKRMAPFITVGK